MFYNNSVPRLFHKCSEGVHIFFLNRSVSYQVFINQQQQQKSVLRVFHNKCSESV